LTSYQFSVFSFQIQVDQFSVCQTESLKTDKLSSDNRQLKTDNWRLKIKMILLLPLLIISVFLEGTITALPLVLVCLLCLTILKRDAVVFFAAFFAGLILDVLVVHRVGGASIFFLSYVFLILLYQKKYEINSYIFVAVSAFLGSLGFLGMFGYGNMFWQALVSSLIAVVLFAIFKLGERGKRQG
jgi:cell shape-determining protein MreD